MNKMLKSISMFLGIAAFIFGFSSSANASYISWDITGPGTTTSTETGPGVYELSYSLNNAGFSTNTWTVTGDVLTDGDYTFDWDYTGLHAWYAVTAFLVTSDGDILYDAGPTNCCASPSNGFSVDGVYTFANALAGSTIGFTLGGSNFDYNNFLQGTLTLAQVPEPSTLALMAISLLAFGFTKRKRA